MTQHDTLDQIREHLEAIRDRMNRRNYEFPFGDDYDYAHENAVAALAKFDALLAQGDEWWCYLAQQIADRNMALVEIRGYLREISHYVPAGTDGGGCLVHCAKLIDKHLPGQTLIYSSDRGATYPPLDGAS